MSTRMTRAASIAMLILISACGGGAGSPTTSAGASAAERPTDVAAATTTPTSKPTSAATATAVPIVAPVLPGEPWILYGKYQAQNLKAVLLMRPDGTDSRRILKELGDLRAATWSSDGSKIAFVYQGPGAARDGEIWTAAPDGSGAARLFDPTPECTGAFHPSWSPDDRRMAFVCYTDTEDKLAEIELNTGKITILFKTAWPNHLDNPPRWSPDGLKIAFDILHWDTSNTYLDGSLLAVVPAGGGMVRHVTEMDSFAAYPDWSPDGTELLFNDHDQGNMVDTAYSSNLWAIRPDGSGLRQLTTQSKNGTFRITQGRWDPSGDRIWVTIWQPAKGIAVGWVNPLTGEVSTGLQEGSVPQPRPTN